MRILVLNYEFPPVGGGGGHASASLCRALAARGHRIQVLTSAVPGLPRWQEQDGYLVRRVATGRRSRFKASFLSMAAYILLGLVPGLRMIARWKPEVLHAHFAVPTGVLANVLARLTNTPYVLTAHLGDVPGGVPEKTGGWFRLVYPWTPRIWRQAAAVAAVGEHTKGLALRHYDVPIEVIPNGIALPPVSDLREGLAEPPRLVFAGRFQPQKNLPTLVRALAAVRDLDWDCVLVGDGPDSERVDRLIRQHDLVGRVAQTGWIDSGDVEDQLRQSDLLTMPSLSEGLPVVGIQALAWGLALVCSRAGGLVELVDDRVNGRLSKPGDEQGFAAGLRWCLEDRQRLLSLKQASRTKAERYDLASIAERYEQFLAAAASR